MWLMIEFGMMYIMKLSKNYLYQVRNQCVYNPTRIQVYDQVGDQVRDQVIDQVWDQVWHQVWIQVWIQVGDQINEII
jgi:hypothetical protein